MSAELITVNLTGFFILVQQHQEQWALRGTCIAQLNLPLEMRPNRWLQGENQGFKIDLRIYIGGSGTFCDASTVINYSWKLYHCQFGPITGMCHQPLQWVGFFFFFVNSRRNMHVKKDNIWKQISPLIKTQVILLVFCTKYLLRFSLSLCLMEKIQTVLWKQDRGPKLTLRVFLKREL